jgi:hypothetical protein
MVKQKFEVLGIVVSKTDIKKFSFASKLKDISVGQGVGVENGHTIIIGVVENIEHTPKDAWKKLDINQQLSITGKSEEYTKRTTTSVYHCRIALVLRGLDIIDNCKSPPLPGSSVLKIERVEGVVFQPKNKDKD